MGEEEGTYLGDLLAVQIVARLRERLQTEGCTDHDEQERNAEQRGMSLQPQVER